MIRPAQPADYATIREITTAAFDRSQGDEAGIIEGVRAEGAVLAELVAEEDGVVVGHVLFNRMRTPPRVSLPALAPWR